LRGELYREKKKEKKKEKNKKRKGGRGGTAKQGNACSALTAASNKRAARTADSTRAAGIKRMTLFCLKSGKERNEVGGFFLDIFELLILSPIAS